jgi:Ca2+-binding EF-hand superfamily protein
MQRALAKRGWKIDVIFRLMDKSKDGTIDFQELKGIFTDM